MTDEQLVAAFESNQLPAEAFTHTNHVRVAWWYLRQDSFPGALLRFSTALRRFAESKGASGKYHETITVAYMLIIADRLTRNPSGSWKEFVEGNPDLLQSRPAVLESFYSASTLTSDRARQGFVMPDRLHM